VKTAREKEVAVKDELRDALSERDEAAEAIRRDDMLSSRAVKAQLAPFEKKVRNPKPTNRTSHTNLKLKFRHDMTCTLGKPRPKSSPPCTLGKPRPKSSPPTLHPDLGTTRASPRQIPIPPNECETNPRLGLPTDNKMNGIEIQTPPASASSKTFSRG
jgi:hypothetical protein